MGLKHIPNLLSLLRIVLTIPIIISLLKAQYLLTLVLFLISALTDGLDGFIAKRFNCQTWLGAVLDPLADKILLVSTFLALFYLGLVPIWLVIIILSRDVILVAGMVGYYYVVGIGSAGNIVPSNISKLNTFLQIFVVLSIIIAQLYSPLTEWLAILYVIVATSTLLSGVDYAWMWGKHTIDKHKQTLNNTEN